MADADRTGAVHGGIVADLRTGLGAGAVHLYDLLIVPAASDDGSSPGIGRRLLRAARSVIITILLTLFVLVILEGVSGGVMFVIGVRERVQLGGNRAVNEFGEELGWIQLPNREVPDLWGPGRDFRSNSQRFRADYDIAEEEPAGRARLICSGDSFTFGYGVDGGDAWCQLLGQIDPRFEPVNLGQGGYGVGQSYLWFMRSTEQLEHSVHLFAFIPVDFSRMRRTTFRLWQKPKLVLDNGELVVVKPTIRRDPELMSWIETRRNVAKQFNVWRLVKWIEAAFESSDGDTGAASPDGGRISAGPPPLPDSASRGVASAVFRSLDERNRAKGSTLVLVHLPGPGDFGPPGSSPLYESWNRFLREDAERYGHVYIDLVEALRDLPEDEEWRMFIHRGLDGYRDATGHYSEYGNEVVARVLYDRLMEVPAIARRLASAGD